MARQSGSTTAPARTAATSTLAAIPSLEVAERCFQRWDSFNMGPGSQDLDPQETKWYYIFYICEPPGLQNRRSRQEVIPLTLTDDNPARELSLGKVMCADLRPTANGTVQRKHLFSNARDAVKFSAQKRSTKSPQILRPYWCLFCEGVHLTSKNPPPLQIPPYPPNPDLRTWTGKKKDKKRRSRCGRKGHL